MTRRATGIVVSAALVLIAALIAGACSGSSHKAASSPTTSPRSSTSATSGARGSGSGSSPSPSPSPSTPTPAPPSSVPPPATALACKVVTQAEVSRLFGHPAVPVAAAPGGPSECVWRYDGKVGPAGVVSYRLQVFAYRDGMPHSIDVVQDSQSNVSSSGSGNVTVRNSHDVDTVEAASNGKTVVLAYSVSGDNVPDPPNASSRDADLHALARSAAARM